MVSSIKYGCLALMLLMLCYSCSSRTAISAELYPFYRPYVGLVGDTICFKNEQGKADSIVIEHIDSFHRSGSFMNEESRGVYIYINK